MSGAGAGGPGPARPRGDARPGRAGPGTLRRLGAVSVEPENLDINKSLNFHHEETSIH